MKAVETFCFTGICMINNQSLSTIVFIPSPVFVGQSFCLWRFRNKAQDLKPGIKIVILWWHQDHSVSLTITKCSAHTHENINHAIVDRNRSCTGKKMQIACSIWKLCHYVGLGLKNIGNSLFFTKSRELMSYMLCVGVDSLNQCQHW